jgi:hypothetical protein
MIPQELQFESPSFNRRIIIQPRPNNLTSDAGAIVLREVAERLGMLDWLVRGLDDTRTASHVTHPLRELLSTVLILLGLGYRDRDDVDVLHQDPALRLAVSTRTGDAPLLAPSGPEPSPDGLASQPTLSRTVDMLSSETNRALLNSSLAVAAGRRLRAANHGHRLRHVTLDLDSLPIEVSGQQPGSSFHGHYHSTIYHPLVASLGEEGDLVGVMLRAGCASSADDSLPFLLSTIAGLRREVAQDVDVRFDAAFPQEERLAALEQRRIQYVGRLANNAVLDRLAQPYQEQQASARRTKDPGQILAVHECKYAAQAWSRKRRVVLVIQERPGELLPHHFWLVTNYSPLRKSGMALLQHYRRRGSAEAAMGEWMSIFQPALSSTPRPKSHYRRRVLTAPEETPQAREERLLEACQRSFGINETWLLLNALAYNLVHAVRMLIQVGTHDGWSIRRTRERLLKVGAQCLRSARYVTLAIPDVAGRLWEVLWYKLSHLHWDKKQSLKK